MAVTTQIAVKKFTQQQQKQSTDTVFHFFKNFSFNFKLLKKGSLSNIAYC